MKRVSFRLKKRERTSYEAALLGKLASSVLDLEMIMQEGVTNQ